MVLWNRIFRHKRIGGYISFNPNIPQVTNPTLQSFFQLRANFQAINAAFTTNHAPLVGNNETFGKHSALTLRAQNGDPVTDPTQIAIYNKLVSSIPEMFFRPNSSQTPIQLTYPSIKTDSSNVQYSFVAGPFIVYGGFITGPITQGQVVTLNPGTNLRYVDLMMTNSKVLPLISHTLAPILTGGTTFTINYQNSTNNVFDAYYFAIGQ